MIDQDGAKVINLSNYLETEGDTGHEKETEDDGSKEEEDEVSSHVGSSVNFQGHNTVLSSSKSGSKTLKINKIQDKGSMSTIIFLFCTTSVSLINGLNSSMCQL